ncbi:MAG: hypothetical protein EOP11_24085 [Proteobacteria bacterium]|nr:MAG: hypothetical protein EOP11_24085 [Pseudomonadota bacterium]
MANLKKILKNNGLSLTMGALFLLCFTGQVLTGRLEHNEEAVKHGEMALSLGQYLHSAHFGEATMENWESEFLQMGLYVILTAFLFQKGSAESKSLTEENSVDEDPRLGKKRNSPWPVKRGGLILRLYENSLGLALLILFAVSFFMHAHFGMEAHNEEAARHGSPLLSSLWEYIGTSQFWFESFQNWQSEFFSIGAVVLLSIYLRQRGSPESKPVAMAHSDQDPA